MEQTSAAREIIPMDVFIVIIAAATAACPPDTARTEGLLGPEDARGFRVLLDLLGLWAPRAM